MGTIRSKSANENESDEPTITASSELVSSNVWCFGIYAHIYYTRYNNLRMSSSMFENRKKIRIKCIIAIE